MKNGEFYFCYPSVTIIPIAAKIYIAYQQICEMFISQNYPDSQNHQTFVLQNFPT